MLQLSGLAHADLEVLQRVIASSPIKFEARSLVARLSDWASARQAPDVDTLILDWLASQGRRARGARRLDA